jgi:hypothetical protein
VDDLRGRDPFLIELVAGRFEMRQNPAFHELLKFWYQATLFERIARQFTKT